MNLTNAIGFLSAQLGVGLVVLLSLNQTTQILGLASMPLVVAYPLMKRYTNWPQLILGLTFNWGALVGYTAGNFIIYNLSYKVLSSYTIYNSNWMFYT